MKSSILFLFILLMGCSKENISDSSFQLPPETQVGANTFGVTINGKVYVPRDPTGFSTSPQIKGMTFWGSPDNISWNEIEVIDGAGSTGFKMVIHIQNFNTIGVGNYQVHDSNFQSGVDSSPQTNVFFKIWNSEQNNYQYYKSIENQGEINITRNSGGIVSGNFKGTFLLYGSSDEFITITDGRFDINTFTLPTHHFQ